MRARRGALLAALALAVAAVAAPGRLAAHDLFLRPSSFVVAPGQPVEVALRLGHPGEDEEVPLDGRRVARFEAVGAGGPAVVGAGSDARGHFLAADEGLYAIGYVSHPSAHQVDAAPFEAYLVEEGLEPVVAARRASGRSGQPGRELFSRSVKTLVRVGAAAATGAPDRRLGLPLELLREEAPPLSLRVRLLFSGEPLAGALVEARPLSAGGTAVAGRTDAAGAVELPAAPGDWVVTAVHMVPAAAGEDAADWRSYWTSSTFRAER